MSNLQILISHELDCRVNVEQKTLMEAWLEDETLGSADPDVVTAKQELEQVRNILSVKDKCEIFKNDKSRKEISKYMSFLYHL